DPRTQPDPAIHGRSANGRFAKGNPGCPGNPFYRQQADFRRACLALFTPEDVASLLRVMLALGRNGNTAAARVFLDYTVGKAHKAAAPDREEHHEWQLFAEAPKLADVTELLDNGVPADLANDATRDAVPHLATNRLEGVFDSLDAMQPAEPATEEPEAQAAPPPPGQPSRETLELLTATLRAAVANGDIGSLQGLFQQMRDRPTGDNGGRTVPTADNGQRSTVATGDNDSGPGRGTWPAAPVGADRPAGAGPD